MYWMPGRINWLDGDSSVYLALKYDLSLLSHFSRGMMSQLAHRSGTTEPWD